MRFSFGTSGCCAGLIIGVLNMMGLRVKITSIILGLAGGTLWIALLTLSAMKNR